MVKDLEKGLHSVTYHCLTKILANQRIRMLFHHFYCICFFLFCITLASVHSYHVANRLPHLHKGMRLLAGAPKKGGGGGQPISSDKIRVRLLQDVKEIGKKNELVYVSKTMYQNVLQIRKLAEKITEEQASDYLNNQRLAAEKEIADTKALIQKVSGINDIVFVRKAGVSGQLFGAITTKQVLEEMKLKIVDKSEKERLDKKQVAVLGMRAVNVDGTIASADMVTEARKVGKYQVEMKLHNDLPHAKFFIEVKAE